MKTEERIQQLITDWTTNPRWKGIERPYTAEKSNKPTRFISIRIFYCAPELKFWNKLNNQIGLQVLGALTGNKV